MGVFSQGLKILVVPVQSAVVSANKIFPSAGVLVRNLTVTVAVKNCPKAHNSFLILVRILNQINPTNIVTPFSFGFIFVCLFLSRQPPQWARASSFTTFLDHTQRRTAVGRAPLDEWSARRRDLYLTTHNTHNRQTSMPPGGIRTHNPNRRAATGTGWDAF